MVVVFFDDRFSPIPCASIEYVAVREPPTITLFERRHFEDITTIFSIAVFEHANDLMMKSAIGAESSHVSNVAREDLTRRTPPIL